MAKKLPDISDLSDFYIKDNNASPNELVNRFKKTEENIRSKTSQKKSDSSELVNEKKRDEEVETKETSNVKSVKKDSEELSHKDILDYFDKKDEIFYRSAVKVNPKLVGKQRVSTHLYKAVKNALVEAAQVHDISIEQLLNNICLQWLAKNQDYITDKKDEQRKRNEAELKNII